MPLQLWFILNSGFTKSGTAGGWHHRNHSTHLGWACVAVLHRLGITSDMVFRPTGCCSPRQIALCVTAALSTAAADERQNFLGMCILGGLALPYFGTFRPCRSFLQRRSWCLIMLVKGYFACSPGLYSDSVGPAFCSIALY